MANRAKVKGGENSLSVCTFIASDFPLMEAAPNHDYPNEIDIDNSTIYDGGADDNYFLHFFMDVQNYTQKVNGVYLEWNYTEGRAEQIIEYIKNALKNTPSIELWHVWLMDYYEFEDRPVIHRQTISIDEITPRHIKVIDDAEIWNTPDKMYPNRPSFYCLEIKR
ncbi:hypothetical protein [Butyricicoccus pullicaecorum]|uniref:hypothetical protein n=1 Tax=Butyricicoccus pullicaecorum TaxID=501571 RepID=UPI0011606547|nr:hypothetical protein [Butyricicoccus pullicaecorum]